MRSTAPRSGAEENSLVATAVALNSNMEESETHYHLLQPLLPPVQAELVRDSKDVTIPTARGDGSYASSMSEYMQSQEWKDHVCDCCIHGPCHPSLLCGCCFPSLGMAQVFFRILEHRRRKIMLFWFIVLFVVTEVLIGYFIRLKMIAHCWNEEASMESSSFQDLPPSCVEWIVLQKCTSLGFFLTTVLLIAVARHFVRRRYHIKPCIRTQHLCPTCCCCCCCGGHAKRNISSSTNQFDEEWLEDCCISCCCPTCVTCQVMRQTGNYETYRASCCSYSGLPSGITYDYSP